MTTNLTTTSNTSNNTNIIHITAPSGSKAKSKLSAALQEIKDALSGKKIYNF